MVDRFKPIAILGAGSWGTALALHLARCEQTVRIWSIETAEINAMRSEKANNRYLPGFDLPDRIIPIPDLSDAVTGVDDILIVVPSVGYRQTLLQLKQFIEPTQRILSAAKGLDEKTGHLLNQVVEETLGTDYLFAALSGPSFAREVAAGLPTAVALASKHQNFLVDLKHRFHSPNFNVYTTDDVIGVELGGVVKNVIAIAIGISDGMGFGANTRCALLTHGLTEMIHLGTALGGKAETFYGLSGLGDLILTCTDDQSRNRRLGLAIGIGKDITTAEQEIGQAVEGKRNAELVTKLAKQYDVEMPICTTVWNILQSKVDAREVLPKLI